MIAVYDPFSLNIYLPWVNLGLLHNHKTQSNQIDDYIATMPHSFPYRV